MANHNIYGINIISHRKVHVWGKQDALKPFVIVVYWRVLMHNLISRNQLAGWNNLEMSDNAYEQTDLVNDYFNCLIECEDDQPSCKRICKEMLV